MRTICFVSISLLLCAGTTLGQSIQQGDNFFYKGRKQLASQKYDSAKLLLTTATEFYKSTGEIALFLEASAFLLETQYRLGEQNQAIEKGKQLLLTYDDVINNSPKLATRFYYSLGLNHLRSQSGSAQGMTYVKQANKLFRNSSYSTDDFLEAKIFSALAGAYYYSMEYDSVIIYRKKAISTFRNQGKNGRAISINYRGLGNAYWGLKQFKKASDYYERSLEILKGLEEVDSLAIGRVIHSQGYIHLDSEDFPQALLTFQKATRYLDPVLPDVHPALVWVLGDVGRTLLHLESYDSALNYLQKALIANTYEFNNNDPYINPDLKNINDDFQHFMILKLKGETLAKKYLDQHQKRDLETMFDTYEKADQQIDLIRKALTSSADQSNLADNSTDIYNEAFKNFLAIHQKDFDQESLENAHYFFEKYNTSSVHLKFLEILAKSKNLAPRDLLDKEEKLISDLTALKSTLLQMHELNSDSISTVQTQLFEAEQDHENFIALLKSNYPDYHNAKYNVNPLRLKTIQQALAAKRPKTAIISYFVYEPRLNVSVITKDTAVFLSDQLGQSLSDLVIKFREAVTDPADTTYSQHGIQLSKILLDRAMDVIGTSDSITELVVVPASSLQPIPFGLLQSTGDAIYLFEQYNISYHYSASLFTQQLLAPAEAANIRFAGYAPNFGIKGEINEKSLATVRSGAGLDPLPGAEIEVSEISRLISGESNIRDLATEEHFKQSIGDVGLLHIATHAIVDEIDPEASYLQFAKAQNGIEDGKLHFFEIYNLKFRAQLVTLSACNTGFGKIRKGEGVMSLSRAFAYAGVPATVVSLWPASDKSTPELMTYFYQNLKDGQAKDVALNNARKQYLATAKGKARHPFYWGGFVLIGDSSPLEEDSNILLWAIISVLAIVIVLALYWKKRKATVL